MTEIWKPVVGYEEIYSVSNFGNVVRHSNKGSDGRKPKTKRMSQKAAGWKGEYLAVTLTENNITKNQYVHRIVASAFLGIPADKSLQVNHKDGNKRNNHVENLEWVTAKENQQHRYSVLGHSQKGENNATNKYPESTIIKIREMFKSGLYSQREIARQTGVDYRYVHTIVHNRVWKT